jgi:hypothetical protein
MKRKADEEERKGEKTKLKTRREDGIYEWHCAMEGKLGKTCPREGFTMPVSLVPNA